MTQNIQDLISALKANAERVARPVPVNVDGIGTMYFRPRTVEDVSRIAEGQSAPGGALAGMMCKEDGSRYTAEEMAEIAPLLAKQPEDLIVAVGRAMGAAEDTEAGKSAPAGTS